jgi:hypothetical protein
MVQQSSRIDPCQSILVVPSIILDHNNLTSRIGLAHQPSQQPHFRRSIAFFIFCHLPTDIHLPPALHPVMVALC